MSQHLIDTPIKLSQCSQCDAYVFACDASGFRVMADPAPVGTMEAAREALVAGRTLYRVIRLAGRPHKLQGLSAATLGAYVADSVAEHRCGATHKHAARVEAVPVGPQQAPVTPGRQPDGFHPRTAPESGSQGHTELLTELVATDAAILAALTDSSPQPPHSHAGNASPRRSSPTRCDICRELITPDTNGVWAIEHDGRYVYARHDAC